MSKKLQITLKGSHIGRPETQRATLRALGLKKREQTVIHEDNPAIRGAIEKVRHLLEIEEINA